MRMKFIRRAYPRPLTFSQAIQHIFHTSGYNYPKRTDVDEVAKLFGGSRGIVAVGSKEIRPIDRRLCS